jgi:hypothetical protein
MRTDDRAILRTVVPPMLALLLVGLVSRPIDSVDPAPAAPVTAVDVARAPATQVAP